MATRAWVATELGRRLGVPLAAAFVLATDTAGNLKEPLDDALRMLGAAEDELGEPDGAPGGVWSSDVYTVPFLTLAIYTALKRAWAGVVANFDLSSQGDSLRLSQPVAAIERMLKAAEADVVRMFGMVPSGASDDTGGTVSLDMDYLDTTATVVSHDFPYTVIGVGDG